MFKKKPKRIIYYRDERNDDFAGSASARIKRQPVTADFCFINRRPLWRLTGTFLYRLIASPVAFFTCYFIYGVHIKNRRALFGIRGGYFLYGNHTQSVHDAFAPSLLSFPRKTYIVTSANAVSIPYLRQVVLMLGAIPVSDDLRGYIKFQEAIGERIRKGNAVTIYPEAHIWPYYTGVRDFPDSSFAYPVALNVPAVAFAVTYRKRWIFKNRHPRITITLSKPYYPDTSLPPRQARRILRDQVYGFLKETVCTPENEEYIHYEKANTAPSSPKQQSERRDG